MDTVLLPSSEGYLGAVTILRRPEVRSVASHGLARRTAAFRSGSDWTDCAGAAVYETQPLRSPLSSLIVPKLDEQAERGASGQDRHLRVGRILAVMQREML